jgi:hypothetical protein
MIQLRFPQFVDKGENSSKPKKEVTTAAATSRRCKKFFTWKWLNISEVPGGL